MEIVRLHFNDGRQFDYELISNTNGHIYMQDRLDGTSIRYTKATKELHSYDCYDSSYKYMKNTTELLTRVEIA